MADPTVLTAVVEDEGVGESVAVGLGDFDLARLISAGSSGNNNEECLATGFVMVLLLFDVVSVVPWSILLLLLGPTNVAVDGEDISGVLASCTDLGDNAEDGEDEPDGTGELDDDGFVGSVAVVGEEIAV